MKITLTKRVKVEQLEFIGEVNFFDADSPYMELLKNITSEDNLKEELREKGLTNAAIKNVICKLESLGVIKNGYLDNLKDGFPEKEYGKYELVMYENETGLPFRYKNKDIKRIDAKPWQQYNSLVQNPDLIYKVKDKDNKEYEINTIENNKANITKLESSVMKIIYENGSWRYVLDNKSFETTEINFNSLFDGSWDNESNALKIDYESVIKQVNAAESMEYSYEAPIDIEQYGQLTASFKRIPITPKTSEDAKRWFVYLLKSEIEKKNRYISEDELKSLWSNLLSNKPKFRKFNLVFNFKMILKEFGKDSRYYWLLRASIDLYPFSSKPPPKSRVVIQGEEGISLQTTLFKQFNIEPPRQLIIVDRWIVNLKQFEALEEVIEAFGRPQTTIITQEVKDKRNEIAIDKIIQRNGINRLIRDKRDIVHQRYWKIDDEYYQTSESLDFITIENGGIRTKYTTFELYDEKDLDPNLLRILKVN